jgi:hypothetical protein
MMRKRALTSKEIYVEFMLFSWKYEKDELLDKEIDNAIKRNEVEDKISYMKFLKPLR